MSDPASDLVIPRRFCGPPSSGNGGWTAGALAARLPDGEGAVEVTLRMPPPLETELAVTAAGDRTDQVELRQGDRTVAAARRVGGRPADVPPVTVDQAVAAEAVYPGLVSHPFASCFVCGTGRAEGDGLRIFPGPVEQSDDLPARSAATWTPDPSLTEDDGRVGLAVAWAALDCVGGWAGDFGARLMVLGRMTAVIDTLPRVGERHVVVGQRGTVDGRKTHTTATLRDAAGHVVGSASHVWISVDPADFT